MRWALILLLMPAAAFSGQKAESKINLDLDHGYFDYDAEKEPSQLELDFKYDKFKTEPEKPMIEPEFRYIEETDPTKPDKSFKDKDKEFKVNVNIDI